VARFAVVVLLGLGLACAAKRPEGDAAPKDAGDSADKATLKLSPDAARAAGVEAVPAARDAFRPHLLASGVVRPDPTRSVVVRTRVAGRVVAVQADAGDLVTAGQKLASFEGPDATAAIGRSRTALAKEAVARKALERAERLLAIQAISRAERDARESDLAAAEAELESAGQDLERLGIDASLTPGSGRPSEIPITAPIAGKVIERTATPGLSVDKDASLFVVAELSRVWVVVDVYEKDLGSLEAGGDVEVRTDAWPGVLFKGRLALVEPALDDATRVVHARVVLENPGERLRPGLLVTAALPAKGAASAALSIPLDAVQKINGVTAVFVEKAAGAYELRPVDTGRENGGRIEIVQGLEAGERVVVHGAFILKSELLKGSLGGE
jgi:cobalt-zinc-cadmium efflux system membrane fusion protein